MPPKKIDYVEFLTQFEFLYRGMVMFEMKSENRNFLKKQIKRYLFLHFEILVVIKLRKNYLK